MGGGEFWEPQTHLHPQTPHDILLHMEHRTLRFHEEQALTLTALKEVTRTARESGEYPVQVTLSDLERWIGGGNIGPRLLSERLRGLGIVPARERGMATVELRPGEIEDAVLRITKVGTAYRGKVGMEGLKKGIWEKTLLTLQEWDAHRALRQYAEMDPGFARTLGTEAPKMQADAKVKLEEWQARVDEIRATGKGTWDGAGSYR